MEVNDVTTAIPPDHQALVQPPKKNKCRGNRRDQRFRKKCRARGMKSQKIERLLQERKQIHSQTVSIETDHQRSTTTTAINKNLNKRKRDVSSLALAASHSTVPKSISSISLKPSMKRKKANPITTSVPNEGENLLEKKIIYRQPMYLKRSPYMLFQLLHKRFQHPLKEKYEQRFISARLDLFDRHYFFDTQLQLWQSSMNIGLEQHRWPGNLFELTKTSDFEQCQHYLTNLIEHIKQELNDYEKKLVEQGELCPITAVSLEQIDRNLKEFVHDERKYLLARNTSYLKKFQENIQLNQTLAAICINHSTIDQDKFLSQLMSIRDKQGQVWEEQLTLETRILCRFLPTHFDSVQDYLTSMAHVPLNNERKAIQVDNQHHRMVQGAKRQWLNIGLSIHEMKLQEYDQQYQELFIQFKSFVANTTNSQNEATPSFNQIHEYMINRTREIKQSIINKISAFRRRLVRNRQRVSSTKTMIGVSPEPYLDLIANPFNHREWHHLSLGPSCIRINQSAIRSQKQQEIEIKNIHEDIFLKVQNHLVEYLHVPRTLAIFGDYSHQLRDYLYHAYLTPLSYRDYLQAKEQAQVVASIRRKLRQKHLILRQTDKSNNFYIGSTSEFEKKAQTYFLDTNAYMQLFENPFDEVLNKVIHLLNRLRAKKLILQWQYDEMMPDPKKVELARLYFNPKTHKDGIPVRPILNTIRAPTTKISKFLDKIIRPIFDRHCRTTTIIDGASLIQEIQKQQQKGLFKPTTLFCTSDIRNLYTMLPQEESLNILMEFLHIHGYRKVKGVSLDTIRKLASIVLQENVFVYERQFYRQTIGGAMGSSFTLTLANIFMWKWQKELVRQQDITCEYFGRYIDDIFITWNRSEPKLRTLLNEANDWHPNIKLDYKIGQSLPFLDVLVENKNGVLLTSVYRKPSAEPYVVPYTSDHHPHVFRNIIQTLLARAVRYSSTFEIFHHERRSIKLMLLYNGYPSIFIDNQFERFFSQYIDSSSFLPYVYDEYQFIRMYRKIVDEPTPRQSQVALSASTADVDNEQTDDDIAQREIEEAAAAASTTTTEKRAVSFDKKLFVHYTHEKRFRLFKRDIHRIHGNVFQNTPVMDSRLVVGNRNRRDAKHELTRKRPSPLLLQNKARKIKEKYFKILQRHRSQSNQASTANILH